MSHSPTIAFHSFSGADEGWGCTFEGFTDEIVAWSAAEVMPALNKVQAAVAKGLHAAGFVCYEAAHGINPVLPPLSADRRLPLLRFALFREKISTPSPEILSSSPREPVAINWADPLEAQLYRRRLEQIIDYIAAGDTYQVNFTFQNRFTCHGNPIELYRQLCMSQAPRFGAFIDWDGMCILSASPELFFRLKDGQIITRPMKGTAPRGRWSAEDDQFARELGNSPKERAENLMIVDLLRNDLGIIAETGSVEVADLFAVESLPTVHQMTSTITARLRPGAGIIDIFRALFPCGSITGAPKRRTMELIAQLENEPRGIYTGTIGYLSPGSEAFFTIAIRTALLNTTTGCGSIGIGSGITADSDPTKEYAECLAKLHFAAQPFPDFRLVETILHEENGQYSLLPAHLERLASSAARFGFRLDQSSIEHQLADYADGLQGRHKIRLLLARDGSVELESVAIDPDPPHMIMNIGIADQQVDSRDHLMYHKTTHRPLYRDALKQHAEWDDVLFVNERGEITEGANHNLVIRLNGLMITPALSSGLLPGVFRAKLLREGTIKEGIVTAADLKGAEDLWLINSVRGWRQARLDENLTLP